MRSAIKYFMAIVVAIIGLAAALLVYSTYEDQKNFAAAKNDCERGCLQDSGGLEYCRRICASHAGHYP